MHTVNIHEAKTHLSRLVDNVAAGGEVVIAKSGKPLARLTGLEPAKKTVRFGVLKGKVRIAKDFDAPLPDEVLAGFEGR
jgi:prevent-host-death family protein